MVEATEWAGATPLVGMGTPHFTALVGAAPHGRGVAELAPPLHQAVRPWEQEELRELDFLGWNWGEREVWEGSVVSARGEGSTWPLYRQGEEES